MGETIWVKDVRLVVKPMLCENVFRPLIEFSKRRWRRFLYAPADVTDVVVALSNSFWGSMWRPTGKVAPHLQSKSRSIFLTSNITAIVRHVLGSRRCSAIFICRCIVLPLRFVEVLGEQESKSELPMSVET